MRYEMEKYIDGLAKCMEKARIASECTATDLDINYKIISALVPNGYVHLQECSGYAYLLSKLRMDQVRALGYNTNENAYLYCQLKFCKEFLEAKLKDFLALKEDDEIKEYFVISNYKYNEGMLMENGHIFVAYQDEFDDIIHFYPYPDATGFRSGYGDGIPELSQDIDMYVL